MERDFYENAVDTLEILVSALGTGAAAMGVINMIDAYEQKAANNELAEEYQNRIAEIDLILQGLFAAKASGKIALSEYKALCESYDAEVDEVLETLAEMKKEVQAQKRQGFNQIVGGAELAGAAAVIRAEII